MSLSARNVSFSYGERPVLRDISFDVNPGQLVSVLGPNGTGKTTLFRCLLGLLQPKAGTVQVNGQDIARMRAQELARAIAYIPQAHAPAFNYTALEMVLMGASARLGPFASPGAEEKQAALAAMEKLGVADFAGRDYMRLSGGERQLILIARALAQRSRVLIMDEPTANLDYGNQMRVMERVTALARDGYAILQSTHSPEQAFLFSDGILAMKDGLVLADGRPQDVLTAELIETLYGVRTRVESLDGGRVRVCVPESVANL